MHLTRLALTDFRSYPSADVSLAPGITIFSGPNGEGKTNLVEAVGYVATLASHRVAQDVPLIRKGADQVSPPSVEREKRINESAVRSSVHAM